MVKKKKKSACKVGDLGSFLGSGRFSGEGNGYPLHYSCLGISMDREAWWATAGSRMGGPARDEVMKKIPDRQGRLG